MALAHLVTERLRLRPVMAEDLDMVVALSADARAEYGSFEFPVVLLTGARSPLPARRVVERLNEAPPASQTTEIPDAGHLGPITHAEAVNRILLRSL